jgi:hypothetical protein
LRVARAAVQEMTRRFTKRPTEPTFNGEVCGEEEIERIKCRRCAADGGVG